MQINWLSHSYFMIVSSDFGTYVATSLFKYLDIKSGKTMEDCSAIGEMAKKLCCFFCNLQLSGAKLEKFKIFKTILYPIERKASDLIADLLDIELNESDVHSDLICRKCFTLVNEFAGLDARAAEIRTDLLENYNSTKRFLAKQNKNSHDNTSSSVEEIEYVEADVDEEGEKVERSGENVKITLNAEKLNQLVAEASGGSLQNIVFKNEDGTIERPKLLVVNEGSYEELNWEDVLEESNEEETLDEDYNPDEEEEADDMATYIQSDENMHTCKLCPQGGSNTPFSVDTVNLNLMSLHLRHEHSVRVYLCDICGDGFKKRNLLIAHLNTHTKDSPSEMECDVCHRVFHNWRLFRIHKRQHGAAFKAWSCDICGKHYSSRNLLEDHRNSHHGVRPYKCQNCTKTFTSKYTYRAHLKTHQHRERNFPCSSCNKSFMTQANLLQHVKTHTESKDHICNNCGKGFASLRSLEVHSVVHSGVKPFVCLVCGKAFARKAEIKDHERTHTGERPFTCDICGSGFSQRSNLQSHKRVTHFNDRRYQCNDCGKGFKRRRLLDYHVRAVHTGERPFVCKTCDAAFVYPEHYKKHIRIHTGVKPYKCEVCEKAFNSRDNRNAHRFVHSDKKPYECLVCGVGFMRKPLLYNHMQLAGHMNDTIVVNQPRLDKDDLSNSTVGEQEDYELTIVDENSLRNLMSGKKVIVADGREHVIIEEEGNIRAVVNDDGNKQIINEDGTFIDLDGNTISISQWDDETPMVTHINERGQLVNEEGQVISEDGQALIVDESMEVENGGEHDGKEVQYVQIQVPETEETWLGVKEETG